MAGNVYLPYTYLIGWSKLNLWYYGSQYGKKAHPSNLWRTYFTSLEEVNKIPTGFVRGMLKKCWK
jgi:hypothetical protein